MIFVPKAQLRSLNSVLVDCDDAVATADLFVVARARSVTCHGAVQVVSILRPLRDLLSAEAPVAVLHTTVLVLAVGGAIARAHCSILSQLSKNRGNTFVQL